MTGPQWLILCIIIALVVALAITLLIMYENTKRIIHTNSYLVRRHNALIEKNCSLDSKIEEQRAKLEEQQDELGVQSAELEEQRVKIQMLQRYQEELSDLLRNKAQNEADLLRQQTEARRNDLKRTATMNDQELMAWVDCRMDEARLFTSPTLSLKEVAKAMGLTQKRLLKLLREQAHYVSLNDYLTEKRFLYSCQMMRENPKWTIEAIAKESGFQTRRTFQEVVKAHLGLTPSQYRQTLEVNKPG